MPEPQPKHVSCPVVVFRVEPSQVMGDTMADALRDEFLDLRGHVGARHVVVDFRPVTYLSSAGFRPLLSLLREVRAGGGRLVLCNLHPDVREVFSVTRLIGTNGSAPAAFEVQADVAAAVASLALEAGEGRASPAAAPPATSAQPGA